MLSRIECVTFLYTGCPTGYTEFSGRCYRYYGTINRSWGGAKAYCSDISVGNFSLASVNNQYEMNFIQSLMGSSRTSWLGLYKNAQESWSDAKWTDGSPLVYTNWETGEPNAGVTIIKYEVIPCFEVYNNYKNSITST